MLTWYLTPRHWSPREGYATGDVLLNLLNEGWRLDRATTAPGSSRAPRYLVTLTRDGETLSLLVLDGPAVRDVLPADLRPALTPVA
jgi:hypothetical protein